MKEVQSEIVRFLVHESEARQQIVCLGIPFNLAKLKASQRPLIRSASLMLILSAFSAYIPFIGRITLGSFVFLLAIVTPLVWVWLALLVAVIIGE